jgi:hypothetical protein
MWYHDDIFIFSAVEGKSVSQGLIVMKPVMKRRE